MTTTVNELSGNELTMGSCPMPPSSAISEHSLVQDLLSFIEALRMSSQQVSPVNRFHPQASNLVQTIPATCGPQLSQPSMLFDQSSASLKTLQLSLIADTSEPSSETWPKAGIVSDGKFYPQPRWERRISEIDCGLWPTPNSQEPGWVVGGIVDVVDRDGNPPKHHNQRFYDKKTGRVVQKGLSQVVNMWPTPTARDWRSGHASEATLARNSRPLSEVVVQRMKHQWPTPNASDGTGGPGNSGRQGGLNLRTAVSQFSTPTSQMAKHAEPTEWENSNRPNDLHVPVGGSLSPDWVEWLMGWPIGWTSLEPLNDIDAWLNQTQTSEWWQHEHDLPRTAKGIANHTHRLKAIGNGQVAACVVMAWNILTADTEVVG